MKDLIRNQDLEVCLAESATRPVFVFKHSTACPVSAAAHARVAAYIEQAGAGAPTFHLVRVIESRELSNTIASRLGLKHQSPQLILVCGGKAVWDASHGAIDGPAIEAALEGFAQS